MNDRASRSAGSDTRDMPLVSVIMAIRNEGADVTRSLGAVLSQDYPKDRYEVIVADGMSSDDTLEQVRALQARHRNLHLVPNPGRIVAKGLNEAIRVARGEIIVRVDGHTEISPVYVRECVETLARTGADNVGGRMDAVGRGAWGEAVAAATSSPFGVGGARFHYSDREEQVDTVYLGAWRRETFDRIGLFDEEQVRNQDDELNYRLLDHGGRIVLNPRISSRYFPRSTFRSLWRQYYQYGFWKVRVMQKHPRQMRARQFAPPALVAALLASAFLSPIFKPARALFVIVAGAYAAALLVASAVTSGKRGWQHARLLPVVFATLHLGYGLGFLTGLIRFADRWWKR